MLSHAAADAAPVSVELLLLLAASETTAASMW